jgi:hypothetical protein
VYLNRVRMQKILTFIICAVCLLQIGSAYTTQYYANSVLYTFSYSDGSLIRQTINITGLALTYLSTHTAVYDDTALRITRITQEPTNMYVFPRKAYQYFSFDTNTTAPLSGFAKVFVPDSFFEGLLYSTVDVFSYESGWKQTHSAVAKVSGGYEYTFTLADQNYYVIGSIETQSNSTQTQSEQQIQPTQLEQNQTIVYPLPQAPLIEQQGLFFAAIILALLSVIGGFVLIHAKRKNQQTASQESSAQKDAKKLIAAATKKDPKLQDILSSIQQKYATKKTTQIVAQKSQPELALEVAQLEQETVQKFLVVAKTQQLSIEQVQEQLTQLQIHPQLLEHALVEYESLIGK